MTVQIGFLIAAKTRKNYLSTMLAITMALSLISANPAEAKIRLNNIGLNREAVLNSEYFVDLGLASIKNISLSGSLINDRGEVLKGKPTLISGTRKTGQWKIIWKLDSSIRPGIYKVMLRAKAGKTEWRSEDKSVTLTVPQSNQSQDRQNPAKPIQFGLPKSCGTTGTPCPQITDINKLLPSSTCKIADVTYPNDSDGYVSSGFPAPLNSLAGKKKVKLLWIPVGFADREISSKLYADALLTLQEAEDYFAFNSYGRVEYDFELLGKDILKLPEPVASYEAKWASNSIDITQFLLDQIGDYTSTPPDAIMWLFPVGKYKLTQKPYDPKNKSYTFANSSLPASRVYGLHNELESIGVNGFSHGVGHALYSFEDLYIFAGYSDSGKNEQPGNGWDLMIGGGEFFGWSKWVAYWLLDSEVNCVASQNTSQVLYLRALQDPVGKKMISIPVSNSKVILAEYRTNANQTLVKNYSFCTFKSNGPCNYSYKFSGLLLYELDTSRKHGNAPYRVLQSIDEKLLEIGESAIYLGHEFKVLAADEVGIYVEVKRV